MSWLKKATSGIWRPVRGIGRLLRGKVSEGLGDIGHGARTVAPIVMGATGVGLPLAAGIAAAGGALEKGDDTNWHGKSMLGGAVGGAATGAAGHSVGSLGRAAAGRFLAGGASAGAPASTAAAASAAPGGGAGLSPVQSVSRPLATGMSAPTSVAAQAAGSVPAPAPSTIGSFLRGAGEKAGDAVSWAGRNAGDLGQAAGGVASLAGARDESAERAWMREMIEADRTREEEERARAREMQTFVQPLYAEIIRDLMPGGN